VAEVFKPMSTMAPIPESIPLTAPKALRERGAIAEPLAAAQA
jgi:hypothetical protein